MNNCVLSTARLVFYSVLNLIPICHCECCVLEFNCHLQSNGLLKRLSLFKQMSEVASLSIFQLIWVYFIDELYKLCLMSTKQDFSVHKHKAIKRKCLNVAQHTTNQRGWSMWQRVLQLSFLTFEVEPICSSIWMLLPFEANLKINQPTDGS